MSFVYQAPGQPILTPPRTGLKLYLDEACTQLAVVQTLQGDTIAYSTIYTGEDSLVPEFLGPAGFVNRVWAQVVGGTAQAYPLMAQYSDQLGNLPMLLTGDGPPTEDIGAVGSFYIDQGLGDINTPNDPVLYGPRTPDGWPSTGTHLTGPQGQPGEHRIWNQVSPSAMWVIDHSLSYLPSVTTLDSSNQQIYGDVSWPLATRVVVAFGAPESGIGVLT